MSGVRWIKITTNMFEDEKVDFIESLPEADAILIIWIKLLTQAGKNNMDGFIFLTEKIPYTEEMLAHKFRRPLSVVKLALHTLKQLEMVEFDDSGFLRIANWEKHQNIEGLDKIREQNRIRKQRQRERERQKELEDNSHVMSRDSHATEVELELEEELDIERDIDTTTRLMKSDKDLVIDTWNKLELQQLRGINSNTKRHDRLKSRINEYSLEDVIQAIESISESDFLQGNNDRGWIITFDWLVRPNNFLKVLEGNYIERKKTNGKDGTNSGNTKREADRLKELAIKEGLINEDGTIEDIGEVEF